MKWMRCFLPLVVCLSTSCSGVPYVMKPIQAAPRMQPESGKAMLVIFRSIFYGRIRALNTWMDGKFVGQTKGYTYFIVNVDPGKHSLVGEAGEITGDETGGAEITVEADKVYYLWQGAYPGPSGMRTGFSGSDPERFAKELSNMTYSELDPTLPAPAEDKGAFDRAIARYEARVQEDPGRFKDIQNLVGYR